MPDVRFDTYYRYDDLTRILQGYAEAVSYTHLTLPTNVSMCRSRGAADQ